MKTYQSKSETDVKIHKHRQRQTELFIVSNFPPGCPKQITHISKIQDLMTRQILKFLPCQVDLGHIILPDIADLVIGSKIF